MTEPTSDQRKAIGAFVKGTLSPLIEEVLTKKLTQAASFVADELRAEAALAATVTDEQIQAAWESMPGGLDGFCKQWGFNQFARAILELIADDSGVAVDTEPVWSAIAEWESARIALQRRRDSGELMNADHIDAVTNAEERIDAAIRAAHGVAACAKGKGACAEVSPDKRCFGCPDGVSGPLEDKSNV